MFAHGGINDVGDIGAGYVNYNALGSPGPCGVCPRRNPGQRTRTGQVIRFVAGTGPAPVSNGVMLIGDRPGLHDNKRGAAFQGKAGMELEGLYLPKARLYRSDTFCTTAIKCVRVHEEEPTAEEVAVCAAHWLPWEIEQVRPTVLALAGTGAVKGLLGRDGEDYDAEVHHGLSYAVDRVGGLRWPLVLGRWHMPVFALTHPATGLLGGRFMSYAIGDFEALRGAVAGQYVGMIDKYPQPLYGELTAPGDVLHVLERMSSTRGRWVAVDTETDGGLTGPPWCLSFSTAPGSGWVIPADCKESLNVFNYWLSGDPYRKVLLHNALFDLDVLARLGVKGFKWRDSMHRAYQLGDQPQGLKALAWRLAGMRMVEYQDLVRRDSAMAVAQWALNTQLRIAAAIPAKVKGKKLTLTPIHKEWKKQAGLLGRRTEKLETWLRGNGSHAASVEFPDIWKWWEEREPGVTRMFTSFGGVLPPASIKYVERSAAIRYAARDADATLRTWMALERLKREKQRLVGRE